MTEDVRYPIGKYEPQPYSVKQFNDWLIDIKYLPYLGYLALLPTLGFIYIFATDSRKTGAEVFGGKIWWNNLRPLHALLYGLFAYNAIIGNRGAWIYLFIDVLIGLFSFLIFHYINGDFSKLVDL